MLPFNIIGLRWQVFDPRRRRRRWSEGWNLEDASEREGQDGECMTHSFLSWGVGYTGDGSAQLVFWIDLIFTS